MVLGPVSKGYYYVAKRGRAEMYIERKRAAAKRIDLTVTFDKSCEAFSGCERVGK
jgi:hypothetical protein